MTEICKSHGKEKGGPWECYEANNFFGWEAERVVAVTTGFYILEEASRAKTELILILAESEKEEPKKIFHEIQVMIMAAAIEGVVDVEVIKREMIDLELD